jgi:hypothetical protein
MSEKVYLGTRLMPTLARCSLSALAIAVSSLAVLAPLQASSHREAPFISGLPKVDGSDFYMFKSYAAGRNEFTTLIANYGPLQDAYGGPNYFAMDPDALYEIHIDNNGDGKEDLTFQFRFKNTNSDNKFTVGGKQVSIPLVINSGAIDKPNPAGLNVRETYSVTVVRGDRRSGTKQAVTNASGASAVFDKPVDNIGSKSIPNYKAYADQHIYAVNIPGCSTPAKMFVGQRKESFAVNLGETFDLINIKAPATAFSPTAESDAKDSLADKNVTSIALEVPTACLTSGSETVLGAWTTASLRQARLINPTPKSSNASKAGGAWTQVSRLGMPLVNEVVIGLKDKDQFNHSKPIFDSQFVDYMTNPTFPFLVETLFSAAGVKAPTNFPRNDLVAAFLTGLAGVNQPAKVVPSEMLRLNTAIAATAVGAQKRLGVIDGDNAGFPNGRRPGDDVVDIVLRVAMGRLCTLNLYCKPADAPAGAINFTDGAYLDETSFDTVFPYLKTPISGTAPR